LIWSGPKTCPVRSRRESHARRKDRPQGTTGRWPWGRRCGARALTLPSAPASRTPPPHRFFRRACGVVIGNRWGGRREFSPDRLNGGSSIASVASNQVSGDRCTIVPFAVRLHRFTRSLLSRTISPERAPPHLNAVSSGGRGRRGPSSCSWGEAAISPSPAGPSPPTPTHPSPPVEEAGDPGA